MLRVPNIIKIGQRFTELFNKKLARFMRHGIHATYRYLHVYFLSKQIERTNSAIFSENARRLCFSTLECKQ